MSISNHFPTFFTPKVAVAHSVLSSCQIEISEVLFHCFIGDELPVWIIPEYYSSCLIEIVGLTVNALSVTFLGNPPPPVLAVVLTWHRALRLRCDWLEECPRTHSALHAVNLAQGLRCEGHLFIAHKESSLADRSKRFLDLSMHGNLS